MRKRQKLACWQQILTSLGTSSMSDQEWNTIFKGFLKSWINPYCIQSSCDPSIPLRPELLVRPRKVLQGSQPGSITKIPESVVFPKPTNSTTKSPPREAPNFSKSRDTIVKNPTYKNPDFSIIKTKDSCASPDVLVLYPKNIASKTTQRRNSFGPTQYHKSSSDKIIKRRNTCVPTDTPQYLKLRSGKRHKSGDKPNYKQQPKTPPASLRDNVSKKSSDDSDDQLPLSKFVVNMKSDKPKPWLSSLKPNLTEQGKQSAEVLTIKPKSEKTRAKPLRNSAQKQSKQLKQRLKVPPQKKTTLLQLQKLSKTQGKQSLHKQISQQAENFSKVSGRQNTSTSRVQVNTPPNKLRNSGVKSISAKTLMPAHMPQTAINLKCSEIDGPVAMDLGQKVDIKYGSPNYRCNVFYEHNYNMFRDEDNFQRAQDYAPNRMHMDQDIKLSGPVGSEEASVELVMHDGVYDIPIDVREVEEVDRCLENLNKTSSEIDSQLVHTSEFFEKLTRPSTLEVDKSDLIDIFMSGNEELDYEDEDDDVLSMAASWDGLNDENLPELEPIENAKTAEHIFKPEPYTETLKPVEKEDDPNMQKIKSFRIPKLNAEDLKVQPSVMRALYEMEELEKNNKEYAQPAPLSIVDPPLAESNRKQRDEATAGRRAKEILPVFAPPYRVASESAVALVSANSQQFIPKIPLPTLAYNQGVVNCFKEVFGLSCMQSVDNRCISFNCDHTMKSLGEVKGCLLRMDKDNLMNLYRQTIRSFSLFQIYYTSFVDIFEIRHLWQHLLIMLADCRLYKSISAPLLAHAYEALHKCGMQKEAVKCIMEHVWLPCKAHIYRELTLMTLNILSNANWEDYCDKLIELDKDYNFEIPQNNLITILKSSVGRADKFTNALNLITLHPNSICTNKTIMSILNATSEGYRHRLARASQETPGAESGPSSIIAPSNAVLPYPPFRRHFAAHNSNKNNSFHFSNEYTYANNKKYLDKAN